MTWAIEWDDRARKELRKLSKPTQKKVLHYLRERLATDQDPRSFGKPLSYHKHGLWRYRVRDVCIVCRIEKDVLNVLVIRVAHRKQVYDF